MPLDAQDGKLCMVYGFYDEVAAILGHQEAVAYGSCALVVGAVGDGRISVKLLGEGSSGSFCRMDFVAVIANDGHFAWAVLLGRTAFFWRDVCVDKLRGLRQILDDGSAEMDIYDLEAFADSEDRLSGLYEGVQGSKLETVQLFVDITGAFVPGSEEGRGNVSAAGKDKAVVVPGIVGESGQGEGRSRLFLALKRAGRFGWKRIEGCAQSLKGVLIVDGGIGISGD